MHSISIDILQIKFSSTVNPMCFRSLVVKGDYIIMGRYLGLNCKKSKSLTLASNTENIGLKLKSLTGNK